MIKLSSGDYINVDELIRIEPTEKSLILHFKGGYRTEVLSKNPLLDADTLYLQWENPI